MSEDEIFRLEEDIARRRAQLKLTLAMLRVLIGTNIRAVTGLAATVREAMAQRPVGFAKRHAAPLALIISGLMWLVLRDPTSTVNLGGRLFSRALDGVTQVVHIAATAAIEEASRKTIARAEVHTAVEK